MQVEFLGTGTSTGVPQIGCDCEVCRSSDARDRRLRSSVLVSAGNENILIDCGPDFREQILRSHISDLSAVLLTHEHYDHTSGLDELRCFSKNSPVNIYGESRVLDAVRRRLDYCFSSNLYPGVALLNLCEISDFQCFNIGEISVEPIRVMHYRLPIIGYRIGRFAYITDMLSMPDAEYDKLQNLDVLVINALRHTRHISHQTLHDALVAIERIAPRRAYITHVSHQMGLYVKQSTLLPSDVYLAYDTLQLEVEE